MNILVTSSGRRVSLLRALRSEAQEIEPGSRVFATDIQPELSAACRMADRSIQVPRVTSVDYIKVLRNICREYNIDLIIPTIDPELPVLARNREVFEGDGVSVVISDPELINSCQDKRRVVDFFEEKEIYTPRMVSKDDPEFPIYAKPYDGSGSKDNYIIRDASELREYHLNNEKLLFFEYLDHSIHDEYTLDLYYDRNFDLKCVVPRKRIEVRGGEVNKGMTEYNALVPFVKEKLGKLSGARGCVTLQLFLNGETGDISGIELNPRFGGGYPLSYLAGANFPRWLIGEYLFDEPVEVYDEWERNLLMLRYDDEVLVHGFRHS